MMFIASTSIAWREYCFSLSYFTNDCSYCRFSANPSIPPRLPRQLPHQHISADLSGSDCIHSDYNVRCNQICKAKEFMYRSGQATRISRQSAYKVAKLSAPEDIPGTLFCERLSAAGKIVSEKYSMTPSGIELATFLLTAHCLSQWHPPRTPLKSVVCWTLSTRKAIHNHRSISSG